MKLTFRYRTRVDFDSPVTEHHLLLSCLPRNFDNQRVETVALTLSPNAPWVEDEDWCGNRSVYAYLTEEHTYLEALVTGSCETGLAPQTQREEAPSAVWRVATERTAAGPCIRALYQKLAQSAPETVYERVLHFSQGVHEAMRYEPGTTSIHTTGEEALTSGCGVCQDYAHILLALLRRDGIPARYVVGLMQGEGSSHAWVEANCKGWWYGFDPTNCLLADESYIKISHGRDYGDCVVSRGVFRGKANQTQCIEVSVQPIPEAQ